MVADDKAGKVYRRQGFLYLSVSAGSVGVGCFGGFILQVISRKKVANRDM